MLAACGLVAASRPERSPSGPWCRTQTCRFSGLRIYPGKGMLYVRVDGQQFLFLKQKCKSLFNQRKRAAKIAWTTTYRKQHRKVRRLGRRSDRGVGARQRLTAGAASGDRFR